MRVIFLDVDGVLTYSSYKNKDTADIDVSKVLLLKEICNKTEAGVVISSSWRGSEDYTPAIYYKLIEILVNNDINVLGDTSYIEGELDFEQPNEFSLEDVIKAIEILLNSDD